MNERIICVLLALFLGLGKALFEGGQIVIFELCRFFVFVVKLSLLNICVGLLDFRLELLDLVNALLFGLPAGFHLVEPILELGKLCAELLQTLLGELVGLFFKSHFFDFKLHYLAAYIVKLGGHGIYFGAYGGTGLVDKVDCLIGQKTICNIPVRKGSGGNECAVVYTDAVIDFVALLEASEYRYCVLYGGFVDHDGLETTLKGGVLFDIFAVFVERGCADAVQLTSCKHGL